MKKHGVEETPQDAVFVERGHAFEAGRQHRLDGIDALLSGV